MHIPARLLPTFCTPLLCAALLAGCQSIASERPATLESLEAAKQAFLGAWTKKPGDTFTMEKLSRVIDPDAFVSFDVMSREHTVIRGYDLYASIWGPGMAGFKTARLSETQNVHVWMSPGQAITASIVRLEGETVDGTKIDMPGHLTLGWHRHGDEWRLVHEHMSVGVVDGPTAR